MVGASKGGTGVSGVVAMWRIDHEALLIPHAGPPEIPETQDLSSVSNKFSGAMESYSFDSLDWKGVGIRTCR